MELVTVFETLDTTQAMLMGSRLEAAGIDVEMDPDLDPLAVGAVALSSSGIRLKVRPEDAARAQEVLKATDSEQS